MLPGETELTRTPYLASSIASALVKAVIAPFGGNVSGRVKLAHLADQARHIDDVALRAAQVWQGKFAGRKDADQIQFQQVAEILDREIINRLVRRMPASIVDQTIKTAIAGNRGVNQWLNLCNLGDITTDEMRLARPALV